jgi:hypothetical protein
MTITKQVNVEWWMDEQKPVFYQGMLCFPTSICKVNEHKWEVILTSPGVNDNAQFKVKARLNEFEPVIA